MVLRNRKTNRRNNHNLYPHLKKISKQFTCYYETYLQVAKALFSDLSRQSCKNEAKCKFIRIESNGWFLFRQCEEGRILM